MDFSRRACTEMLLIGKSTSIRRFGNAAVVITADYSNANPFAAGSAQFSRSAANRGWPDFERFEFAIWEWRNRKRRRANNHWRGAGPSYTHSRLARCRRYMHDPSLR